MRSLLFGILLLLCFFQVFAQLETNQWLMYNSRVSITPTSVSNLPPIGISSSIGFGAGTTSVSDASGNLLFACTGQTILDRTLNVMSGLQPGVSFYSDNKVLAAKIPNSSSYYLFYGFKNNYSIIRPNRTLLYAIVDLSLNNGNGSVVKYDQVIDTALSPGFTLVQGDNTDDIWLVTHHNKTDSFFSYKITASGLSNTPVISKAGLNPIPTEYNIADLKSSPNGKMLGAAIYNNYTYYGGWIFMSWQSLELFNFNALTGMVSNRVRSLRTIVQGQRLSVEFSPDNRLFYGCFGDQIVGLQSRCGDMGSSNLFQYNTCYTDSVEFTNYSMYLGNAFSCGAPNVWAGIQMAANKKNYMPYSGNTMSVVNNPNRIGSSSNYSFNGFQQANSNYGRLCMPAFHHKELEKAVKNNIVYKGGCYPNPIAFKITNDTITNIAWDFGDPAGNSNVLSATAPQHVFSAPGYYMVKAIAYGSSGAVIDTLSELLEIKDPSQRLLHDYPKDTSFCDGGKLKIKLNAVNAIFHWTTVSQYGTYYHIGTQDSIEISSTGTYYVEMRQNDCDGCILKDSIHVFVKPVPFSLLGPDRDLCTGDSLELTLYDPRAAYLWSTGDTTKSIRVNIGGEYWVRQEYDNNGCPKTDTIVINQKPGVQFALPNDTTLCSSQNMLLNPGITNATYLWQNGTTQSSLLVTKPGTYWVKVTNQYSCFRSDTIQVSYINAQQVYLGADTTLCFGDSLLLSANLTNAQYAWSNGSADKSIVVRKTGDYWVRVNNGNCTVTDTIHVTFQMPPIINLGIDTTLCTGASLLLKLSIPNANYSWQNNTTASSQLIIQPGLYWVQVQQNSCTVRDSIQITYKPTPQLNLGNDTTICLHQSLLLNVADASIQSYQWQDGSSRSDYTVQAAGTYWVQATGINGCFSRDTIVVSTMPLPVFSLGTDTTLCDGSQLLYQFNLANASYSWNTGNQSSNFTITQPGLYWLKVKQNGCVKTDSISVSYKPIPVVSIGKDTTLCVGATQTLNAFTPNATYLWQDNSTDPSFTVRDPGQYHVTVSLNGCSRSDTIRISFMDKPQFTLGNDMSLCPGQSYVLDPGIRNAQFQWQNGSVLPTYTVTGEGTYRLTATNNCGSTTKSIIITKGLCQLLMPNVFTPNKDNLNDLFRVKYPQFIKTFSMRIYNRWGEIVYESKDPYKGWDGTFRGIEQPVGNYIWFIDLTNNDGKTESYKGNVILVR